VRASEVATPRRYDPRVQPLPTEAGPRSVCAQCGKPLPPPNGSATFVYGVGPVGYQSCASCGAKWRYLWQERPPVRVKPDRGRRLFVVLGAVVLVALVVVGGAALARSKPWSNNHSSARSTTATTTPARPSTTPVTAAPPDAVTAAVYKNLVDPMNFSRAGFLAWVVGQAPATPQYVVNQKVTDYIASANAQLDRLEHTRWPASVAGEIGTLVDADRTFIDDLDKLFVGQQSAPSYITTLQAEAGAVHDADNAVRHKLGLPPAQA
jgi:hypothetical protein